MRQKIALIKELPLSEIYQQLLTLNTLISKYVGTFNKIYSIPINGLGISTRTANALVASGIKNTNQLCKQSKNELLQLRNIGIKAILEIEEALVQQQGLGLRVSTRGE